MLCPQCSYIYAATSSDLQRRRYANFFSILLLAGGVLCFIAYALDRADPSNLYLGIVLIVGECCSIR
jgi:hypothetical protein